MALDHAEDKHRSVSSYAKKLKRDRIKRRVVTP
jgi:hypothetical protein